MESARDAPGSQIDRATSRLTLRKVRSGDYRVNFRDGNEMTPYYSRLDNFSGQLHIPGRWFKYIACSRQDRRDD